MKIFSKFLLAGLAAFSMSLSGCGEAPHTHTWSDKWSNNETLHWVTATCHPEVCNLLGDHVDTDNDSYCDTCGYKMSSGPINPEKKNFTDLVFNDQEFQYDGLSHSLSVTNVPEGAEVKYENNDKVDVGVYTVKATVSKEGYNTKVLTAKLTIIGTDFEGVTFESKTFDYDGKAHSLEVSGAPEGAKVTYTNNSKINVGVYKVTAKVTKSGYNDLTLEATLTINPIDFEGLVFEDKTFEYDGKAHSLAVENVPSGARVTYNGNGKTNVGTYKVTATVSKTGYNTKTLTATLEITPAKDPIEVDPTKTAFPLNEKTTFDEFKEAILGGNYTVSYQVGSRFLFYSGDKDPIDYDKHDPIDYSKYDEIKNVIDEVATYGVADGSAFEKITTLYHDPVSTETTYTKVVGDYAFSKYIDTHYSTEYFNKIPVMAFDETFSKKYSAEVFNHLRRTDDNGFESFTYTDFYNYYTIFEFSDGVFTMDVYNHENHSDIKRATEEYVIYTFSNIGNTKVNIPSQHIGSVSDAANYDVGKFVYQGISYYSGSDKVSANITLDYAEVDYLPKGHLTLLPEVYGLPVKNLSMDFYTVKWEHHKTDYTGYILDTEFDKNFKYCFEYKQYGYLNPTDINNWALATIVGKFQSFGGKINYRVNVADVGFFQDRTDGSLTNLDKYNISVINADYYSAKQIEAIQETGTKVFGYVDAGRISKSDSHYDEFKDITLKPCEDDPNYYWVDVTNSSWETFVKDTLIQGLFDKGVDGVYLDGVRVYEEYDDYYYDVRQAIGRMMAKVSDDIELMIQSCDNLMSHLCWDYPENYSPHYVDYYVQEEVFTKVEDKATNTFVAQSSEVESKLKTDLKAITEKFKNLQIVLLEYEVDETINEKIKSYCDEMNYHCSISNKAIFN